MGEEVSEEERTSMEEAVSELESVLQEDNIDEINSKSQRLAELAGALAQKAYEKQQQNEEGSTSKEEDSDNVVDADFEEVKDEKSDKS